MRCAENLLLKALVLFFLLCAPAINAAGKVDFARDIRPILSDNCFACHGPDEKSRKGGLRLDLREDAFKPGKSGELPIVKGAPEKSEIYERLVTSDADEIMPPTKTKKNLSPAQIDLIKRWIAEGAEYSLHWAFETPRKPEIPKPTQDAGRIRNPIDAFVLQRLEKEGLKFSPEADRATLIRRAALDITGLPPSPEEVDAFVRDEDPKAYERLLERLFKSPRYGEHMVRYWLDAARYADSHGFHIDSQRDIWPYRDWVVQAFNKNMPFDQFTIEQLAGDMLPGATRDQKVATGYVRCNMSTGEGGAIEAEYQAKYGFDRVETTGAIWLGLTLTCARCHSHKYDPFSQKEYYGLFSMFNNLDEPIMDGNRPDPSPTLRLPTPSQVVQQENLKRKISELEKELKEPKASLDKDQAAWAAKWHASMSGQLTPIIPSSAESKPQGTNISPSTLQIQSDASILVGGPNPPQDVHEVRFKSPGGMISAIRLESIPHASLASGGDSRSSSGFKLSEVELEWVPDEKDAKPKGLKINRALAGSQVSGGEIDKAIDGKKETAWSPSTQSASTNSFAALFLLEEPAQIPAGAELRFRLRFEASTNSQTLGHYKIQAASSEALARKLTPRFFSPWHQIGPFKIDNLLQAFHQAYPPETGIDLKAAYPGIRDQNKWGRREHADGVYHELVHEIHGIHGVYYLHRLVQRDSPVRADLTFKAHEAYKVWVNDRLIAWSTNRSPAEAQRVVVDLKKGENKILVKVVSEAVSSGFTFNLEPRDSQNIQGDVAAALLVSSTPPVAQMERVTRFFRRHNSTGYRKDELELELLREQEAAVNRSIPVTLIARELDKPRETHLLLRGEYDKKGEKVEAHFPSIFPTPSSGIPTNRLGLAKWLVDPAHPLTARVTVNRFWQQVFGVGLVKTSEDFGVQGERPSHPELLDWLATEFVAQGWDVKEIMRLILSSHTYRQTSRASAELRAKDPENRLLARGPRFRVDGEVVRDVVLSISGLMVEKRGGRAARPFEPGGLWEAVSFNNVQRYVMDTDDGQYRRSIYTNWKRQSPPPNMLVFDAPTREYCVVKRPRTNTPLQALVTLNDPQFVEAANAFAQRILENGGGGLDTRIQFAFKHATGRKADPAEIALIKDIYRKQLADFRKDRAAAEKLLSVGSFRPSATWNRAELAAWSTIASMILNLDETLTKS